MNGLTTKQLEALPRPQKKANSFVAADGSQSSANLLRPATKGERTCLCSGVLQETKGHYGWIIPHQKIDHPDNRKHRGGVYLDTRDIRPGSPLRKGDDVSFFLFADSGGLGAEDCRLKDAAAERPEAKPQLWETLKSRSPLTGELLRELQQPSSTSSAAAPSGRGSVRKASANGASCIALNTAIPPPAAASGGKFFAKPVRRGAASPRRFRNEVAAAGNGSVAPEAKFKSFESDPILSMLLQPRHGNAGKSRRKDSEDEASEDTDSNTSTRAETESRSSNHSSPSSVIVRPTSCDDAEDDEEGQLVDLLRAELRQARAKAGALAADLGHKQQTMASKCALPAAPQMPSGFRPPPGLPAPDGKPFEQLLGELNMCGMHGESKAPPGLAAPIHKGLLGMLGFEN